MTDPTGNAVYRDAFERLRSSYAGQTPVSYTRLRPGGRAAGLNAAVAAARGKVFVFVANDFQPGLGPRRAPSRLSRAPPRARERRDRRRIHPGGAEARAVHELAGADRKAVRDSVRGGAHRSPRVLLLRWQQLGEARLPRARRIVRRELPRAGLGRLRVRSSAMGGGNASRLRRGRHRDPHAPADPPRALPDHARRRSGAADIRAQATRSPRTACARSPTRRRFAGAERRSHRLPASS